MNTPSPLVAETRPEKDSLGTQDVPLAALYGIQTQRACQNFPISGTPLGSMPELLRAFALVKKAAAMANQALGRLPAAKASIIAAVCDEISDGQHLEHFPIDVFQGGAGTSTNMNINEVIANRGLEMMELPRGDYASLHPNDDVNLSQSTNDTYPTAVRLAILLAAPSLIAALDRLADSFAAKGKEFSTVLKLGRTQLQDAVPMTLGQEFNAFAVTIREDVLRLGESLSLMREVNLGGTAIGTGITADPAYPALAVANLARLSGIPVVLAANLVEACWDTGAFVHFSGVLKRVAVKLSKISNDLRLLSSGPRGGLGEIRLPAVQPGSSIMPGKVNPVIPEVVNQVAFHVIGADLTVTMAAEAGQLQLNAFEPVIVFGLLTSVRILANAADTLATRCVYGIEADEAVCKRHLEAGAALATALVPELGYERAAELAKSILNSGQSLRDLLLQSGEISAERIGLLLDPTTLTRSQ